MRYFSCTFHGSGAMKNALKFLDLAISVFSGPFRVFFRLKGHFQVTPFVPRLLPSFEFRNRFSNILFVRVIDFATMVSI